MRNEVQTNFKASPEDVAMTTLRSVYFIKKYKMQKMGFDGRYRQSIFHLFL